MPLLAALTENSRIAARKHQWTSADVTLAVPYALASVGRRAELRADQHAAALGFAPMPAAVLDELHRAEQHQQAQAAAVAAYHGRPPPQESPLSKLLASHPDHCTGCTTSSRTCIPSARTRRRAVTPYETG
ncbi:hypothetical protein [Streptomyces sp. NPDC000229]|uniref:hypothetical protein n=1 Tax=Streptomyces sp. NPDC000229 TaxID=3154247 RepID=UPI003325F11E